MAALSPAATSGRLLLTCAVAGLPQLGVVPLKAHLTLLAVWVLVAGLPGVFGGGGSSGLGCSLAVLPSGKLEVRGTCLQLLHTLVHVRAQRSLHGLAVETIHKGVFDGHVAEHANCASRQRIELTGVVRQRLVGLREVKQAPGRPGGLPLEVLGQTLPHIHIGHGD
jgi:hypothetical protein